MLALIRLIYRNNFRKIFGNKHPHLHWLVAVLCVSPLIFFDFSIEMNINTSLANTELEISETVFPLRYMQLDSLGGLSDATLSTNIGDMRDYGESMLSLNLFHKYRAFYGKNNDGDKVSFQDLKALGVVDSKGYITHLPDNMEQFMLLMAHGRKKYDFQSEKGTEAGKHIFRYKGEGEIVFSNNIGEVIQTGENEYLIDYTAQGNSWITIKSTDPNNTGNYLRDFEIIPIEYVDLYDAGEIFHPVMLEIYKDIRNGRFMGPMETNNSAIREWGEYPIDADYAFWNVGMPIEVMVRLANRVGFDPWFTMPAEANDEFIENFALYVKENLDPNLVAHIELSNEVWNFAFTRHFQYFNAMGENLFGTKGGGTWINAYGKRSYEVMKIWTDIFGNETQDRLMRIMGTQTANAWITKQALTAPLWQDADLDNYIPPHTMIDAIGVTTYFGSSVIISTFFQDKILEAINDDSINVLDYMRDIIIDDIPGSGTISFTSDSLTITGSGTNFTTDIPNSTKDDSTKMSTRYSIMVGESEFEISFIESDTTIILKKKPSGDMTGVAWKIRGNGNLNTLFQQYEKQAAVADDYNLKMIGYEGGSHVLHSFATGLDQATLDIFLQTFIDFDRSPQMAEIYDRGWNMWQSIGDGPYNQFGTVSAPSKYGSWGSIAHVYDSTPKHLILQQKNIANQGWWDNNNNNGGAYQYGKFYEKGTSGNDVLLGTSQEDSIVGFAGDDTFYTGEGDDIINGSKGTDTVYLKGFMKHSTITQEGERYKIVGPEGTDYITGVEKVVFFTEGETIASSGVSLNIPKTRNDSGLIVRQTELKNKSRVGYNQTNNYLETCSTVQDIQGTNYYLEKSTDYVFTDERYSPERMNIRKFQDLGIVNGYKDGSFLPNNGVSRVEFLKILLKAHCYNYQDGDMTSMHYTDVDKNGWQAKVILKAEKLNLINGSKDSNGNRVFRPNDYTTKLEAIKIILNMSELQIDARLATNYNDIEIPWHRLYIETAESLGIYEAYMDKQVFDINSIVSREDMIGLLDRTIQLYK